MIEYDKERQEHLEPGLFEPTADDSLLTREIPVAIKVCIAVLFQLLCYARWISLLFKVINSNVIVCANLGLSGNFVTCSKEHQLW